MKILYCNILNFELNQKIYIIDNESGKNLVAGSSDIAKLPAAIYDITKSEDNIQKIVLKGGNAHLKEQIENKTKIKVELEK